MRSLCTLVLMTFLAPAALAQVYEDDFSSYPNGSIITGWTQQRGAWQVQNGRLSTTSSGWNYITKDGYVLTDSCLEGEFFYSTSSSVQFAGLTSRHPGTSLDSDLVMCKIQNNGGTADFDRCFIYERGYGSNIYVDIPGGTLQAYCRMITLGNEVWMYIDADQDGIWELTLGPRVLTNVLGPGLVGMNAYTTTEMSNFKLFDAVLKEAPGSTPSINSTYTMQFRAPQPQGTPFICAASLTATQRIPIDTRYMPIDLDFFFLLSLSTPGLFNFSGMLDANGDGFPTIQIPNLPYLVGVSFYVAGLTIVPGAPSDIGNLSNNHRVEITP